MSGRSTIFSIITVSYNAVGDIERTVRSVMEQDFRDFEYLIIDGASKDGTPKKAAEITGRYDDINVTIISCLLYTSPSPRDAHESRMPASA